jgi:hypothetical protein
MHPTCVQTLKTCISNIDLMFLTPLSANAAVWGRTHIGTTSTPGTSERTQPSGLRITYMTVKVRTSGSSSIEAASEAMQVEQRGTCATVQSTDAAFACLQAQSANFASPQLIYTSIQRKSQCCLQQHRRPCRCAREAGALHCGPVQSTNAAFACLQAQSASFASP